jgi:hypothetical protein
LAPRVSTRLTASKGRRFGFTLGFGFLALGALLLWRDRQIAATVTGGLGSVMLLAGLMIPTLLGPVERGWMALAHAISKVTTPIFMALVYYLTIFPIGTVMRALGRNPLVHAAKDGGFWVVHERRNANHMNHQF